MVDPLAQSLVVGTAVGGAAAYLGSLMITRHMALVGDALGHVALPGMGLAILLKLDPSLGAFAFLALGILIIWQLRERTPLGLETLVGIVFVSSLALGFLIVPEPELLETLIGDISRLSTATTTLAVLLSALVFLLVRRIYRGMILMSVSRDLAEVEGVRSRTYNLVYLLAVALIVSVGIRVTGSLLVGALVIIPPATARALSTNLKEYATTSTVAGIFSCVTGIVAARLTHFRAGPAIILVSTLLFALAVVFRDTRRSRQRLTDRPPRHSRREQEPHENRAAAGPRRG